MAQRKFSTGYWVVRMKDGVTLMALIRMVQTQCSTSVSQKYFVDTSVNGSFTSAFCFILSAVAIGKPDRDVRKASRCSGNQH